jgi:hypothetical protein
VLQNDDYIQFATENTVEVLALSRLDEAIGKQEARAATFEGHRRGEPVQYLVSWPNLTAADVDALHKSKAGQYNDTGAIPVTFLVNPHTLEEITRWKGAVTVDDLVEAVKAARKTLEEAHGEGFARKAFLKFLAAEEKAWEKVVKGDFAAAVKEVDKAIAKSAEWPEPMAMRGQTLRRLVIEAAEKRLAEVEALLGEDPAKGKAELRKLLPKLKGTGLEERAKALLESGA